MQFRHAALRSLGVLALALTAVVTQLNGVAYASGAPTFYLSVHAGQCAIYSATTGEHPLVVPCSDAQHNMEVYVVTHGGWGTTLPARSVINADARRICLSNFQRLYGGALRANFGYLFFFADPGAQTQQYRDRLICSLTRWPNAHAALGAGTHFRAAAQ